MRKIIVAFSLVSALIGGVAHADIRAASKAVIAANCSNGMQENVTVSVNLNLMADSFAQAKAKYDEKMQAVTDFAKKQNVKKFDLQSMSYNVNSNNNNGNMVYQLNGNAGYQMDNADAAFKLAEFLTQQKFQVSVSASSYRNGNCNNQPAE